MNQQLLIIGGSARAAAYSAHRAGFSPRTIDVFGDTDLRALCPATRVDDYPDGLLAAAIDEPASEWIYTGALENYPLIVEDIAQRRPLLGNRAEVLCRVREATELAEVLSRHKLAYPESTLTPPAAGSGGRWLRKPRRSASGHGIGFSDAAESSSAAGYYFQRFVEGTPCAAIYVAAGGRATLLGVTQQLCGTPWTGAQPFHYAGSLGPLALRDETRDELVRLGDVLSREFNLIGLFGVDGILADGVFWTVEVNPRYTASIEIVERAWSQSAMALHVKACRGTLLPANLPESPQHVGKALLFARQPVPARDEFWRDVFAEQQAFDWPQVADLPGPGVSVEKGAPIMTLFAAGADLAEVEQQLQAAAQAWERRLYG